MRLSAREKTIVGAGVVFVAALGFWLGVWEPVQARLRLLDRKVESKRAEYRQIQELAARFERLRGRIEEIEIDLSRARGFSLLSFLEDLAKRQQVRDTIKEAKIKGGETTRYYEENTVEVRMERVRLPQLVQYLFHVENSPHLLRVKQLTIKPRFDDPDLLDVRFQVSAYQPLKET